MKLVLDMNLPPAWCGELAQLGHDARHWSAVGAATATDAEVMAHARAESWVVVTHDLDFGALLAATRARGPSVVLLRCGDISSSTVLSLLVAALDACEAELDSGAIVTVEESSRRVRALPMFP